MSYSMLMACPFFCSSSGRRANNSCLTLAMLLLLGYTTRLMAQPSLMALHLSLRHFTWSSTSFILFLKRVSPDEIKLRSLYLSFFSSSVDGFLGMLQYLIQWSQIDSARLATYLGSGLQPRFFSFLSCAGEISINFDCKAPSSFSSIALSFYHFFS